MIDFSGKKFKDDPILIGGDFNLKISEALKIVEDKSYWYIVDSEEDDPSGRKEHIDYFLVYKLHISNVSYESLTLKDPGRIFSEIDEKQITDDGSVQVDPNKLLDHSPHLADLDLGSLPYGSAMVKNVIRKCKIIYQFSLFYIYFSL